MGSGEEFGAGSGEGSGEGSELSPFIKLESNNLVL